MEDYNMKNQKMDVENFIENKLPEITLDCLTKIKSSFLVLNNSFFTITNKDLIVLKCFISKNSNSNITKFLPEVGSCLNEEAYSKTSVLYESLRNVTAKILSNSDNKKTSMKVKAVTRAIKYKNKIVGYINFTTLDTKIIKILNIFMESLSLNIERELEKAFLEKDLINYLKLINIKVDKELINCLSEKEKLISRYMLMAYSNTEIADSLHISESTVKTYFRRIYEKCGTNNRVDTTIAIICSNILHKL